MKKCISYLLLTLGRENEATSLEGKMLHQLTSIFPNLQLVQLQVVAKSADNVNKAIDTILVGSDCREDVNDKKQWAI